MAIVLLLLCAAAQASPDPRYEKQVLPYLSAHCRDCHGGEKPKGDFRLEQLDPAFSTRAGEERWKTVLEQIQAGAMPPKKKTRPPEAETRDVADWIAGRVATVEAARRAAEGRTVLRRLNRQEYANTIRDLLEVQVDLKDVLALDSSMDGFDNVGAALHLSSFALERYLEAADKALSAAIAVKPAPPSTRKRYSLKESHQVARSQEPAFRLLDDTVVCLTSVHWQRVSLPHFWPQEGGHYRFRICASGYQSQGKPVSFEVTGGPQGVDYFDAPADTPTVFEFVAWKPMHSGVGILPYRLGHPSAVKAAGVDKYDGPGLAVHWVEIEGPLNDSWPPPSHRRLFGELPLRPADPKRRDRLETVSENPREDAERILRAFARRAFRRAVTDAELRPVFDLVHARLAEQEPFAQAVRVGLSALLVSKRFLFLDETPGPLDDFALAGRLSYFLWSSMPDEELLALAERRELGAPDTLRAQVERMLRSPKAEALTKNFCGQWLGLRDIDFTAPGHIAYPEYDEMLKLSMVREAELFFAELLRDDLSLLNFVASDFSMLNGRLARHYGIPGVDGLWEFRKVPLPPDRHRGGVLTMAAVLKVTANGTSTSPITRGAWVLERLLGTPPPKPPADVPALEPDIRGATTIREQLAKHRAIESCAACHAKIDPPGFALESFDVIGGWRDFYRLTTWVKGAKPIQGVSYLEGPRVDPSGELADGRAFRDVDGLKQHLLSDPDAIARALARRLATYATGGAAEGADRPELDRIVARVRAKNYGLRSLVHEIVLSRLFREK